MLSSLLRKGALDLDRPAGRCDAGECRNCLQLCAIQIKSLDIDPAEFENADVHLHVPAGALPKDGPSAGVAMVMALVSLFCNRPVRSDVGISGEITLRGRVLPVEGIKLKVLAAHRAGLKTVILPECNRRDLEDLPEEVASSMNFITADHIDTVLGAALVADHKHESIDASRPDHMAIDTDGCDVHRDPMPAAT